MKITGLRTSPAIWATGDMLHKETMSPKPKPNQEGTDLYLEKKVEEIKETIRRQKDPS